LDKIYKARNSTYQLIEKSNVDSAIVDKNISQIIKIFTETSNGFESKSCLKLKEEEMNVDKDANCFADISRSIRFALGDSYHITVGEKAYLYTSYSTFNSYYCFNLGPLFFEVFQSKC
jgi:hypothetical protein